MQKNGLIYLANTLPLEKIPMSRKDDSNRPLTELTNRLSSRSQNSVPIANKVVMKEKVIPNNNSLKESNSNKEN